MGPSAQRPIVLCIHRSGWVDSSAENICLCGIYGVEVVLNVRGHLPLIMPELLVRHGWGYMRFCRLPNTVEICGSRGLQGAWLCTRLSVISSRVVQSTMWMSQKDMEKSKEIMLWWIAWDDVDVWESGIHFLYLVRVSLDYTRDNCTVLRPELITCKTIHFVSMYFFRIKPHAKCRRRKGDQHHLCAFGNVSVYLRNTWS